MRKSIIQPCESSTHSIERTLGYTTRSTNNSTWRSVAELDGKSQNHSALVQFFVPSDEQAINRKKNN